MLIYGNNMKKMENFYLKKSNLFNYAWKLRKIKNIINKKCKFLYNFFLIGNSMI
jgi:hypothetical protein